ncbi:hypothetical protein BH11GEM2_BH11GEM2_01960 [soil metagenome]
MFNGVHVVPPVCTDNSGTVRPTDVIRSRGCRNSAFLMNRNAPRSSRRSSSPPREIPRPWYRGPAAPYRGWRSRVRPHGQQDIRRGPLRLLSSARHGSMVPAVSPIAQGHAVSDKAEILQSHRTCVIALRTQRDAVRFQVSGVVLSASDSRVSPHPPHTRAGQADVSPQSSSSTLAAVMLFERVSHSIFPNAAALTPFSFADPAFPAR